MTDKSNAKDKKQKPTEPPEQQVGDTPVPPWEMPSPEEKEQAKPIKKALKKAVANVDSQEKADEVIGDLEAANAGKKASEVEQMQSPPQTTESAAREVTKAEKAAPKSRKTQEVLETTARALTTSDKHLQETVSEAAQEVLNPEQQGAPMVAEPRQREFLRKAVLKRLKPLDALDANLFLAVNHLPHTRPLNLLFYGLTLAFQGAAAWHMVTGIAALRKRRRAKSLFREVALPLVISTSLVEYPIKTYFKRRRPFITIIQAIVIGKKPGSWSFPSGHSAGAFAGAWLLNRKSRRFRGLRYMIASLVAFSRIYLGDHYPGDVLSGSLFGMLFAMFFGWLMRVRRQG